MAENRTYSFGEVASLVRSNLYGWGVVASLFCIIPAAQVFSAIPEFTELFKGFGAELPAGTQFVINWPYLLWVLPTLAVLLFILALAASPEKAVARHRVIVAAFAVLCGASLIALGLVVRALYAPIFALGEVV